MAGSRIRGITSKLIKTDLVYKEWIQDVSRRFRRSQLKAAVKVNGEMLRFYCSLGQDISRMNKDARCGTEFYLTYFMVSPCFQDTM